ncbi:glycosyltransferase [Belliella marina]|uniref:Glycosyltransferase n=1 Tax=Belliella marina TaxID=1644146 RepID=A0ABW4VM88_9BACT
MLHKRILILHSSSDLYGAGRSLLRSSKALVNEGYHIKVLLSDDGPLCESIKELGGEVEILRLGILRKKYLKLLGLINRLYYLSAAIWKIYKMIKRENYPIVYSNTSTVLAGAYAAKLAKVKHVNHVREIVLSPQVYKKFITSSLKQTSDLIICVSNAVLENYPPLKAAGTAKVIYNGIDFEKYYSNQKNENEPFTVTTIGRINPGKGQLFFLKVINEIIKEYGNVNIKFQIVGDPYTGYEYILKEILDYIEQENLGDYVDYLGFRKDIPEILANSDLFILPSNEPDSLPNVVLEAMSSSLPVIATLSGGASEMVVLGKSGYLVEIDNIEQTKNAVMQLYFNRNESKAMGLEGRKIVEQKFSLERYEQELLKAINALYQ